jgi:hypothetical protein
MVQVWMRATSNGSVLTLTLDNLTVKVEVHA